jgi:hypothetical protein
MLTGRYRSGNGLGGARGFERRIIADSCICQTAVDLLDALRQNMIILIAARFDHARQTGNL